MHVNWVFEYSNEIAHLKSNLYAFDHSLNSSHSCQKFHSFRSDEPKQLLLRFVKSVICWLRPLQKPSRLFPWNFFSNFPNTSWPKDWLTVVYFYSIGPKVSNLTHLSYFQANNKTFHIEINLLLDRNEHTQERSITTTALTCCRRVVHDVPFKWRSPVRLPLGIWILAKNSMGHDDLLFQ